MEIKKYILKEDCDFNDANFSINLFHFVIEKK